MGGVGAGIRNWELGGIFSKVRSGRHNFFFTLKKVSCHKTPSPLRGRGGFQSQIRLLRSVALKFSHHNLQIELDDTWYHEAEMDGFIPRTRAYLVNIDVANGKNVFEVRIDEVRPVKRNPGVRIFNDNQEASAKERVIRILKGFRSGSAIPPVEIVFEPCDSQFRYKLVAGVHRFYCSWPLASRTFQRWKDMTVLQINEYLGQVALRI